MPTRKRGRPQGSKRFTPRPLIYDSLKSCAGSTGIPLAVLKEAKASNCPAFVNTRVNLPTFLAWWFSEREGLGINSEQEKAMILREERLALERERMKDEKQTILVDEAKSMFASALLPVRQRLMSLPNDACSDCNIHDSQLAHAVLQRWVDDSMPLVRGDIVLGVGEPDPVKETKPVEPNEGEDEL